MIDSSPRAFFAVDVSADSTPTLMLNIVAVRSGVPVAMGNGSAPIQGGKGTTMTVALNVGALPPSDMATSPRDIGPAVDMSGLGDMSGPDLAGVPTCTFDNANTTLSNCVFAP